MVVGGIIKRRKILKNGDRLLHREYWDLKGYYGREARKRAWESVVRTGPWKMAISTKWKTISYEGDGGKKY